MNINAINTNLQMQSASLQRNHSQGENFGNVLESAINNNDTSEIRKAAIEMESFFINQMFQAMRRTVPEPQGIFEESNAQRIWQEMMDEETANQLAAGGGLGIADALYEQLKRAAG